jgi:hypothetical protein
LTIAGETHGISAKRKVAQKQLGHAETVCAASVAARRRPAVRRPLGDAVENWRGAGLEECKYNRSGES